MQPVNEEDPFPELPSSAADEKSKGQAEDRDENLETWEESGEVEPSDCLCMTDAPPGLPESVMQMWFKPYGHVLELRPLEEASSAGQQAWFVQMSCVEEAMNSVAALNGKSIMRGKPLQLEYWHDETAEKPASRVAQLEQSEAQRSEELKVEPSPLQTETRTGPGIDRLRLLEACRAANAKRTDPDWPDQLQQQSEVTGIDGQSLLSACRDALATRKAMPPAETSQDTGNADDWEQLVDDQDAEEDAPEAWEESACLCMTGQPPGLPEMVMQFWFKPFGQVIQMRPLAPAESGHATPAFLVQMGSTEEAVSAVASLNGKPIMKGRPLLLEYWHGAP